MKSPGSRNPHWRERWLVFTTILMIVWFRAPPLPRLQPHEFALYVTGLLIGSALVYAVFGRLLVWVWLGLSGVVRAAGSSFRDAADNRQAMTAITHQLMAQRPDSLERHVRTATVTTLPEGNPIPSSVPAEPHTARVLN